MLKATATLLGFLLYGPQRVSSVRPKDVFEREAQQALLEANSSSHSALGDPCATAIAKLKAFLNKAVTERDRFYLEDEFVMAAWNDWLDQTYVLQKFESELIMGFEILSRPITPVMNRLEAIVRKGATLKASVETLTPTGNLAAVGTSLKDFLLEARNLNYVADTDSEEPSELDAYEEAVRDTRKYQQVFSGFYLNKETGKVDQAAWKEYMTHDKTLRLTLADGIGGTDGHSIITSADWIDGIITVFLASDANQEGSGFSLFLVFFRDCLGSTQGSEGTEGNGQVPDDVVAAQKAYTDAFFWRR